MLKKIIVSITIILMMVMTASASVRPIFVEVDQYGMVPAEWIAIIAVSFAFFDNFGRAWDKKRKNPEFQYNYAYLKTTILASVGIGLIALGMGVTSLGLEEIMGAIILGMGGNLTAKDATKGTR